MLERKFAYHSKPNFDQQQAFTALCARPMVSSIDGQKLLKGPLLVQHFSFKNISAI